MLSPWSYSSHIPAQEHSAVHISPALWHRHFLVQRGWALHPHFKSSLQALDASGSNVHWGAQVVSFLVQPKASGDGTGVCAWRLVVQMLLWYTARFACCSSAACNVKAMQNHCIWVGILYLSDSYYLFLATSTINYSPWKEEYSPWSVTFVRKDLFSAHWRNLHGLSCCTIHMYNAPVV